MNWLFFFFFLVFLDGWRAEPSAKNSVENNWKTLSGLNSSIMSRKYMKAQNRSMIQVLFTDCCADEITLKTMALKLIQNGHLGLGFQHFLELVPSATVQNLQLKTKFTHDYHLFFFPGHETLWRYFLILFWKSKWYLPLQRLWRTKTVSLFFRSMKQNLSADSIQNC